MFARLMSRLPNDDSVCVYNLRVVLIPLRDDDGDVTIERETRVGIEAIC